MRKLTLVLALSLLSAVSLFAGTVTLGFEGAANFGANKIQTFYQQKYGVTFSSNAMVWDTSTYNPSYLNGYYFPYVNTKDANCVSHSGNTCTGLKQSFTSNYVLQGHLGQSSNLFMNVANGLTGFLSFSSEGANKETFVEVFSGLNGTGTLLGRINIPKSGTGILSTWSNEISFDPTFTLDFFGVGHSVLFFQGHEGFIEYDNVKFDTPVPEPGSLMLFASGALGLMVPIRRRLAA